MPGNPKHLEFIEGIINRLGGNSFQIKGWNVALATAAVGFAASKDSHPTAAALAVVPSLALWLLDGYYLALERLYRDLYDSADTGATAAYSLKPARLTPGLWAAAAWRWSVAGLHLPMIAVILTVMLTNFGR
ncbi:MAG TPA: hypothetical protein VHD85_20965 [Terracidiphilus sp.]|jgi:hypothetical protein|nr:hypothetical protein [Terracidiphilus sp.]